MRRALPLLLLAVFVQHLPGQSHADTATADCACVNRDGVKVPLGELACLQVGDKMFTARCDWSLNLLTWRKVADGCLSARAPAFTPIPRG